MNYYKNIILFHIRSGSYGNTKLDGLDFITAESWPKAIHEGFTLLPQFVDINAKIDGRKSSFSVAGIVNVETESFINHVTGEEQDTEVQIPKGFIWKLADAAKSKIMRITSPEMNYDHSGKNAFYSVVEYEGP